MAPILFKLDYGYWPIVLKGAIGYQGCVAVVDVNSSLREIPAGIKLIDQSSVYSLQIKGALNYNHYTVQSNLESRR